MSDLSEKHLNNSKTGTASPGVKGWERILADAVNVAILVVCALIVGVGGLRFLRTRPHPLTAPKIGDRVDIAGLSLAKQNLIMAVSTTCHFCSASAPFYQKLIPLAISNNLRVIAVLPQPTAEARTYFQSLRLPDGAAFSQKDLRSISVSGTPTLMLVDSRGAIEKAWVGKLSPTQEVEVDTAIGTLATSGQ